MNLPRSIVVGPFTYRVHHSKKEWKKFEEQECAGQTCISSSNIYLNPQITGPVLKEVLLHETLHACWHLAGNVDDLIHKPNQEVREEAAVRVMSTPLLQVLRDNPLLVAYLLADGG